LECDLAPLTLALERFAATEPRAISVLDLVHLAADQAHDYDGGHLPEEVQGDLELLDDGYYAGSDAFEAAFQGYFAAWA